MESARFAAGHNPEPPPQGLRQQHVHQSGHPLFGRRGRGHAYLGFGNIYLQEVVEGSQGQRFRCFSQPQNSSIPETQGKQEQIHERGTSKLEFGRRAQPAISLGSG